MFLKQLLNVSFLVVTGSALPLTAEPEAGPRPLGRASGLILRPAQAKPVKSIPRCRPGPVANYLAADAERCWHEAPHGLWRTLRHELHYDVVVIEIEAESLRDADEIARRIVANLGDSGLPFNARRLRFREVMLYVQEASAPETSPVRRIRWTRTGGYESLTFDGSLRR